MSVLRAGLLEGAETVRAVFSTRRGGASAAPFDMNLSFRVGDDPGAVAENRRRVLADVDASPDDLALPVQVHGRNVAAVSVPGSFPECDALVTASARVVLGVTVADCMPVLLVDPAAGAVGAVHAGWRGAAAGVLTAALERMVEDFGCRPARLLAAIGPSAGVCCYEVGDEVAEKFGSELVVRRGGKTYLDLRAAACEELRRAGLPGAQVQLVGGCTICAPDLYHSFRRDGDRSGRMMGLIRLAG